MKNKEIVRMSNESKTQRGERNCCKFSERRGENEAGWTAVEKWNLSTRSRGPPEQSWDIPEAENDGLRFPREIYDD